MTKKNTYLSIKTIYMGLFTFLILLFPEVNFAYQNHNLDKFDDLDKKSLNKQKNKSGKNNDSQRLILFDDNLYLLDDDFDFGDEELELLKLDLNPDDIEISREYEDFLNAFFENSTLIRPPNSSQESKPPIMKKEIYAPSRKKQVEDLEPIDSRDSKELIPPRRTKGKPPSSTKNQIEYLAPEEPSNKINLPTKQVESDTSSTTIKNKITILPCIGFGMNYLLSYNNIGPIFGGSISYGMNKWMNFGAEMMFIYIPQTDSTTPRNHTMAITGFNKINIINNIDLKVGLSFLKTGYDTSLGLAAGAGLSFPIGKMFIIQPMVDLNFASVENNIVGINLNIGISL